MFLFFSYHYYNMKPIPLELFKSVTPSELLLQRWNKPGKEVNSPHITAMIQHFNKVSNWISTEIIKVEEVSARAITLNRFILVAQKCLELNNFNSVMEILSSLQVNRYLYYRDYSKSTFPIPISSSPYLLNISSSILSCISIYCYY